MNDDGLTFPGAGWPTGPIEEALANLRGQIEDLKLRTAVDPEGELSRTWRMLQLKRGSRRA